MYRNVEIKARIENIEDLELRIAKIAEDGPTTIFQDDTFFKCANGRLKLRTFSEKYGELIFYQRDDQLEPTESFYIRTSTNDPSTLREALKLAYGEVGRVIKNRKLYYAGRTRIHVDQVERLGNFIELEVVLKKYEDVNTGIDEADEILQQLSIDKSCLIRCAYVDLIPQNDA
ncbi:Adenylate cyclase (EC [Olavius sp. associated proteobacterium Delta 1]|nr:Adenylate cyclase (EC [Olavius sp. associated proteobacterium Delta 1]